MKSFNRCPKGPYAELANTLRKILAVAEVRFIEYEEKRYRLLEQWSRDHVYTLKALKYYISDVQSGMEFYTERPRPDGSFWDCVHRNSSAGFSRNGTPAHPLNNAQTSRHQ